jgi:hypothetical protein
MNSSISFKKLIGVEWKHYILFATESLSRIKKDMFLVKLVVLTEKN